MKKKVQSLEKQLTEERDKYKSMVPLFPACVPKPKPVEPQAEDKAVEVPKKKKKKAVIAQEREELLLLKLGGEMNDF